MQLDMHIEKEQEVFGPYEIVEGTISLTTPGDVLISEISVAFTGKSAYTFSPYRIQQTFFRQKSELYLSEKTNPKPPLPGGRHVWTFQFRFPAKGTSLPPSFGHVANTSEKLPVGGSYQTVQSSCYVLYDLTANLQGTDLPKGCPTTTKEHHILFWPNRYTELPDGSLPKAYLHRISVPQSTPSIPIQKDEINFLQRLRNKFTQTQNFHVLDLVAQIPRYTILGQPLQVNLSMRPGDDMHEPPKLTLESVNYALHAKTRVGRSNSSHRRVFDHIILQRHIKIFSTPFPKADDFIHLHTTAPLTPTTRATWSHPVHEKSEMTGPLCPSFESELISRTYVLSVAISVGCEGKLQTKRFSGGEIVLLPPRLDASVNKGAPTELVEEGVVEASGDAVLGPELVAAGVDGMSRVEAEGENVAQEVEAPNGRREELPANVAVVGRIGKERSGELAGDTPTVAELAMTAQQ